MTACTNNGGSRARRAVTAALVGVLSVGAAPMVALATNAAEPVNGEVQLQAAMTADQIRASKVTDADDQDGYHFDDVSAIKFAFNRKAQYVVPTEITNEKANPSVVDIEGNADYKVVYAKPGTSYSLSDGTKVDAIDDPATIITTGIYYACVMDAVSGRFEDAAFIKFEIVNSNLDDAYICDKVDVDDKVIEFNGAEQKFYAGDLSVVVDGKALNTSVSGNGLDVKVFKAGQTDTTTTVVAKEAGDYVARVTLNGVTKDIPFTVVPLDLETADIQLKATAYDTTAVALPKDLTDLVDTINGDPASNYTDDVNFTYDGGINPGTVGKGAYTYTVSDKDADDKNVEKSQKLTVVRYEKPGVVRYNRKQVMSGTQDIGSFDPALVDARTTTGSDSKALDFTISYYKWSPVTGDYTAPVEASATTTPGDYKVVVTIDDSTYTYGGQAAMTFSVSANPIAISEIYVDYKGETIKGGSIRDIYSGSDLMENVEIRAYDEDDELVPSDALELTIKNTNTNKEVETVTETGNYEITIKAAEGTEYQIEGLNKDTFTFKVDQVNIESLDGSKLNAQIRLVGTRGYGDWGDTTYVSTGSAITPTFEYDLTEDIWGYKAGKDWHALAADTYQVTYQKQTKGVNTPVTTDDEWEKVDECVEPGSYRAVLEDAKRGDNFNVDVTVPFQISDTKVFVDVPSGEWYSEAVYKANELGYIGGIGGSNMFAPMGNITRADVACVLYRMAGGKISASQEDLTNENYQTISKFSDVDPNAYYAKAVAWTTEMGITNGYGDTFGSARTITTEEFATMLARYAEICGTDTSVDTDAVLAEVADGDEVSGYARDAVAWAVSEGYVASNGNLIDPQGTVYRARAVVIAVRYQPEALDDVLVDDPNLDKDETRA